jgi:NADH-quinone oxidoreductase subunit N
MPEQLLQDLSHIAPEIALTATFLAAILVDVTFKRTSLLVAAVTLIGMIVTGVLVVAQSGLEVSVFGNMLAVDPFAYFFKLIIIISALFVLILSLWSRELSVVQQRLGEYYALLPALTLGMMLMAGASNMLMMYLAVELSSLASYILTGFTREASDSSEASLKYVIY